MIQTIKKMHHVWWLLMVNSFRTQMSTSLGSAGYLVGKLLRFSLFLVYLIAIFDHLPGLKGYGMPEVVLFFMTFNLIDVGSQFLFRGIYGIKYMIEEGDFDKVLTQPVHALFRISSTSVDLLDLLTLIPIGFVTTWTLSKISTPITPGQIFLYIFLLINAMVIAYAFHVFVGALSVRTQELESAIWVYRDVMTLGRFPISIYSELVRGILVTLVPIGIMVTFPAKALLGLLSIEGIAYAFLLSIVFHFGAQWFWRRTLKEYASISS